MFFRNKARRRPSTTAVAAQSLESRALLSVTAGLSNNTLTITGTAGNDGVIVNNYGNYTRVISGGNATFFPSSQITSLVVDLGGGNDSFDLRHASKQFDRLAIKMGTGGSESVRVETSLVKTLIVDGRSTTTNTVVYGTTVNTLQGTFGAGADKLQIVFGSVVDRIDVDMGRGNDTLSLSGYSVVRSGQINLGDGNDTVSQGRSSRFDTTMNGGSGYDVFSGFRQDGGPRLNSFERTYWS